MSTMESGENAAGVSDLSDRAKEILSKMSPIEAQVILAKRGNRKVLPHLRKTLDEKPEIWRVYVYGDLGRQAQHIWVEMVGGKDLLFKECLTRHTEQLKLELYSPRAVMALL